MVMAVYFYTIHIKYSLMVVLIYYCELLCGMRSDVTIVKAPLAVAIYFQSILVHINMKD